MSLCEMHIDSDAYFAGLHHALSTEADEVMGLLFGDLVDGSSTVHVIATRAYSRLDKQRDRVELAPEQLHAAALEAEQLSCRLRRRVRVLGWYHSHPRITVWPSAVDLRTQAGLQTLDQHFSGLIYSVYASAANCATRVQVACFQTVSPGGGRRDVPVRVLPCASLSRPCVQAWLELPQLLADEERRAFDGVGAAGDRLLRLHNRAVFVRNTCQTLGGLSLPLLAAARVRLRNNRTTLKRLRAERDALKQTAGRRTAVLEDAAGSGVVGSELGRESSEVVSGDESMAADSARYASDSSTVRRQRVSVNGTWNTSPLIGVKVAQPRLCVRRKEVADAGDDDAVTSPVLSRKRRVVEDSDSGDCTSSSVGVEVGCGRSPRLSTSGPAVMTGSSKDRSTSREQCSTSEAAIPLTSEVPHLSVKACADPDDTVPDGVVAVSTSVKDLCSLGKAMR